MNTSHFKPTYSVRRLNIFNISNPELPSYYTASLVQTTSRLEALHYTTLGFVDPGEELNARYRNTNRLVVPLNSILLLLKDVLDSSP